jgi:hypothetical protein
VISQLHTNSGIFSSDMPGARMFMIVTITLIAPMIEEAPIRCTAKISIGNESPVCSDSGGYMVQPPAGPPPGTNRLPIRSVNANGRIQKLKLFMRGSAMSGAPICSGIIQFASPTNAGITAPKIMMSAWLVVIELKNIGSTSCRPGWNSSARMIIAIAPPTKNIVRLNNRYIVPMSLWLVANTQRRQPFCGP